MRVGRKVHQVNTDSIPLKGSEFRVEPAVSGARKQQWRLRMSFGEGATKQGQEVKVRVLGPVWFLDAAVEHPDEDVWILGKVHHELLVLLHLSTNASEGRSQEKNDIN